MTIAAARKYKDKIIIAADSQATWGDNKILNKSKIFQGDGFVVACAGGGREISLFRMFLRTHKPRAGTEEDIVDLLCEFVTWGKSKTNTDNLDMQSLFISDNEIFEIYNYGVNKVDCELANGTFFAIGSGMFLALGAMELGADPIKAVEIAIKYDIGCGGKVTSLEIPIKNVATK